VVAGRLARHANICVLPVSAACSTAAQSLSMRHSLCYSFSNRSCTLMLSWSEHMIGVAVGVQMICVTTCVLARHACWGAAGCLAVCHAGVPRRAQVLGLPVSGRMFVQSVATSLTAGAGGTAPGGGGRRLLAVPPGRTLLQSSVTNLTTAEAEAAIITKGLNLLLAPTTGRKLLAPTGGLELLYACAARTRTCAPCRPAPVLPPACLGTLCPRCWRCLHAVPIDHRH